MCAGCRSIVYFLKFDINLFYTFLVGRLAKALFLIRSPIRQRVTFNIALLVWKCVHCPWSMDSCISTGTLCPGQRRQRAPRLRSVSTACRSIQLSMRPWPSEGKNVNGTANFCVPWNHQFGRFAINFARQQFVSIDVKTFLCFL